MKAIALQLRKLVKQNGDLVRLLKEEAQLRERWSALNLTKTGVHEEGRGMRQSHIFKFCD